MVERERESEREGERERERLDVERYHIKREQRKEGKAGRDNQTNAQSALRRSGYVRTEE